MDFHRFPLPRKDVPTSAGAGHVNGVKAHFSIKSQR